MTGRAVVVGSGRCGTGYVRRLLAAGAVRAGHEQVYGLAQACDRQPPAWDRFDVDCSWLAVPFLARDRPRAALLVRHPLAVVGSMLRLGVFADGRDTDPYTATYYAFRPEIAEWEQEADRALAAWYAWNTAALPWVQGWVRVEHLAPDGTAIRGSLPALRGLLGLPPHHRTREVAARMRAEAQTGDLFNHKPWEGNPVTYVGWAQHSEPLIRRARKLAHMFGYRS